MSESTYTGGLDALAEAERILASPPAHCIMSTPEWRRLVADLRGQLARFKPDCGGVYVASRTAHAGLWKALREAGAPIISTWIDEAGDGETLRYDEFWSRIRDEISRCRCLIFYIAGVQDFPMKGALIEAGIALALDKPVYVVIKDVMLESRSLRPVGTWLHHPLVTQFETLPLAMKGAFPHWPRAQTATEEALKRRHRTTLASLRGTAEGARQGRTSEEIVEASRAGWTFVEQRSGTDRRQNLPAPPKQAIVARSHGDRRLTVNNNTRSGIERRVKTGPRPPSGFDTSERRSGTDRRKS